MSFGQPPQKRLVGTLWKHKKTGGLYTIVRAAKIEADLTPAIVYEDRSGNVWVRPEAEFMDGRFEPINPAFPSNPCSEIALPHE